MERPVFSYRFGTAEFDEARFELRVAGLPVEVERRALEVLAYLLRHAGEVVTKDELLREVWAGRITVDKVLPNAVNKLRRALGEGNAGLISTQARLGYRLDGVVTRTAVGRQHVSPLALSVGQPVPGRENFVLLRQLGRSGGSEVWLAEQPKTHEQRVYKFALAAERLRELKREATLLRLLHDSLADASHTVELLDWNFEAAPFFLECRYGGQTLADWSQTHLAALDTTARLQLFLQIADAVSAAHGVGVLHKDIKPTNVLVSGDGQQPHVRLTDFGSGHLLEPDRLAQLGITRMGLTVQDGTPPDWSSGTPMYLAPEQFEGQAATVKSDVYALGILLYQLLAGRVGSPMVSGWEAEIPDELLQEDLRLATDGNPALRLGSAAELAERLRRLEVRRADQQQQAQAAAVARRDRELLARTQARRPFVLALFALLVVGVVVAVGLQQQSVSARNQARAELARANALARFLNEDLIGRSNPLVSAKGPDATLREVLLSARDRVSASFDTQPATGAVVHSNLAALFGAIDLFAESQAQAERALALLERHGAADSASGVQARAVLVRALSRTGKLAQAEEHLKLLDQQAGESADPLNRMRIEAARSTYLIGRGEFPKAASALRLALSAHDAAEPQQLAQRDTLRLDLISTLTLADQDQAALVEGRSLIEQAQARKGDNELLIAMARLAMARANGEDHAAAEGLLRAAQPVIAERLGENHSRYLNLLGELQGVAFRRGDWPQAISYVQMLHERVKAKFGDQHVLTHVVMMNWARTLSEAGQAKEALPKARSGHEQLLRLAGPASPQTQDAAILVATIALALGDTAQAESMFSGIDPKVLESGRATGLWASGLDALRGIALQQRGDAKAARPLLDAALAALKEEEALAQPSRLYLLAKAARERLP